MGRSKSKLGRKNDPAHRADKPGNKSNAYNQKQYHKFKKQLTKVLQNVHETQVAIHVLRNPKIKTLAVNNDFGKLKVDRILRHSNIKGWKLKSLDLKTKLNDYNEELLILQRHKLKLMNNPSELISGSNMHQLVLT